MPILSGRDPQHIRLAAQALARGELVAFPTETVYGLGARADDDSACAKVFALKGRPAQHPLIVHTADAAGAWAWANAVPEAAKTLAAAFWPGPMSLVLRRRHGHGFAASGGQESLALRVPSHPVAQALLREVQALGVAGIAAPSANRFGRVSPTCAEHVRTEFGDDLLVLDGGACEVGIESAIVDFTGAKPRLLRPGSLPAPALAAALQAELQRPDRQSPRVPGSLLAHYAPSAPVELWSAAELPARCQSLASQSKHAEGVAAWCAIRPPGASWWQPMPDNAWRAGQQLFATLRHFDEQAATVILVEQPGPGPEWDGVRDRLQRAAAASPPGTVPVASAFNPPSDSE